MTVVKICGITNSADALLVADYGAELLGFIFAPTSKRYIAPELAATITKAIHTHYPATCVGVFVVESGTTAADIDALCQQSGVDAAQLVGPGVDEVAPFLQTPAYITIRPASAVAAQLQATIYERPDNASFLPTLQLDAFHPNLYGGTGETAALDIMHALAQQSLRLMLSGGLTPDNVADYVATVRPWAVDVASGTEARPGHKDPDKVARFIQAARSND